MMAWGDAAAEQHEKDQPSTFALPETSVRVAGERFQAAMDEVRKQTNALGRSLRDLEIHARERAGEVRGHYKSTEASRAYTDMADRIAALLGNAQPAAGHKHEPAPKTYDDYGPTYAEKVLDADERRGD